MTFPQMRAMSGDPEQIQRDWKWSRMSDEAREKVRRLKRDGFKDF